MDKLSDTELLRQYASDGSEEAFGMLVQRYLALVRGTAIRQLGIPHLADEVSHAVFLALARKAGSLSRHTALAGWLFRATRFAAAKLARDEERRKRREEEAAAVHAQARAEQTDEQVWGLIAPHLNDALDALTAKDREAVLLRFFEGRPFAEVGHDLRISEAAAKMRVGRAVEKLRGFFRKKGFVLGATALLSALAAKASSVAPVNTIESVVANVAQHGKLVMGTSRLAESIGRQLFLVWLKRTLAGAALILAIAAIVGVTGVALGWFRGRAANPRNPAPAVMPVRPWPQQ